MMLRSDAPAIAALVACPPWKGVRYSRNMSAGDVFILGAGFSKAISEQMPLLKELGQQLEVCGTGGFIGSIQFGGNVELWLSYLAQRHPWLSEPETLRNPRRSPEDRPYVVTSKPANGADPEQEYLYPAAE